MMYRSPSNKTVKGRSGLIGFGLLFAAFGGLLMWLLALPPVLASFNSSHWDEVSCRVISSSVTKLRKVRNPIKSNTSSGPSYRAEIFVQYTGENGVYNGGSYDFTTSYSDSYASEQEIVDRYPVGAQTTCFADPANPHRFVINRDVPMNTWLALAATSLFALFGLGIMALGILGSSKQLEGASEIA